MLEKLNPIPKAYFLGIFHILLTAVFTIILFLLSGMFGLTFLALLMEMEILLFLCLILIAVVIASFFIRKYLRNLEYTGRMFFAAMILPLFVSAWSMLVYGFGFRDIVGTITLTLPVVCYFVSTYFFVWFYRR